MMLNIRAMIEIILDYRVKRWIDMSGVEMSTRAGQERGFRGKISSGLVSIQLLLTMKLIRS
jgi:hypothetical protein